MVHKIYISTYCLYKYTSHTPHSHLSALCIVFRHVFHRIVDSFFSFSLSVSLPLIRGDGGGVVDGWCLLSSTSGLFSFFSSSRSLSCAHTLTTFSYLFSVEDDDQLFSTFFSSSSLLCLSLDVSIKFGVEKQFICVHCNDVMYRIDIWFQKFHITLTHKNFNFRYSSLSRWKMNMENSIFKCHSDAHYINRNNIENVWLHIFVTKRETRMLTR